MRISDWSSDVCSSDLSSGVLSFDGVQLAAPRPLPAGIEDRMVDDELRQRLVTLIEVDRIHLDPDLTFAMFVQRMNAPERAVRKLVNHELGFDHFRSFLNQIGRASCREKVCQSV